MEKLMSLLLLEDDLDTYASFENTIQARKDCTLLGKTNSSYEAIEMVKLYKPEAIIVDLELCDGEGSGFEFLTQVKALNLGYSPIVAVTTNVKSPSIYKNIHNGFADLIFCKQQSDYSIDLVLNAILFARQHPTKDNLNIPNKPSEDTKENRLSDLINCELDNIGINYKLKGRQYIFECLMYMLEGNNDFKEISPLQYVASKHSMFTASIGRAIQTAINEAWRTSPIEDILKYYTAKVNYHSGTPTSMEFIFYYYHKIKEQF